MILSIYWFYGLLCFPFSPGILTPVVPQHLNPLVQFSWLFILFGDESKIRPTCTLAIGYTNCASFYNCKFSKIKFLSSRSDTWTVYIVLVTILCVRAHARVYIIWDALQTVLNIFFIQFCTPPAVQLHISNNHFSDSCSPFTSKQGKSS